MKDSSNVNDALGNPPKQNQSEFAAKVINGAARTAMNKQIGDTAIPVRDSKHISDTEV